MAKHKLAKVVNTSVNCKCGKEIYKLPVKAMPFEIKMAYIRACEDNKAGVWRYDNEEIILCNNCYDKLWEKFGKTRLSSKDFFDMEVK